VPLPNFTAEGYLPPGIHAASLREVQVHFGHGSPTRQLQIGLTEQIVETGRHYASIKRVLLWGSFVTDKPEPADLDYSIVVSVNHHRTPIAANHRRFFVPLDARQFYGIDRNYLVIPDFPLDYYIEKLDFFCRNREGLACGIIEISLRGEFTGDAP
jgi:hypothetical protein